MTLSKDQKVPIDVVGYPSVPALAIALRSGDLPAAYDMTAAFYSDYKAGAVRILAISSDTRTKALPTIPTFNELGIGGQVAYAWSAVATPLNVPSDIQQKLYAALREIAIDKDFEAALTMLSPDMEPQSKNRAETLAQIEVEQALFKPMLQKLSAATK